MGEVEREKIVGEFEEQERKRLGRFVSYHARLAEMQTDYGFDLDVAHQVYGDDLLHPDRSSKTTEKWNNLLAAVHNKPGKQVVLIRKYTQNETVCTGFGAPAEYTTRTFLVLLPSVNPRDFVYDPGGTDKPPYMAIRAEGAQSTGIPFSKSRGGSYVRLYSGDDGQNTSEILLAHGDRDKLTLPEMDIASSDVTILHDPSYKDVQRHVSNVPFLILDRLEV